MPAIEVANHLMVLIPDNPSVNCTIVKVTPESTKVKTLNNTVGIHVNNDQITVTNITFGSATIPDPGPYTVGFNATANKVKSNNQAVLRKDDLSAIINATPKTPGNPPVDTPISFHIKISVAGQDKFKAS